MDIERLLLLQAPVAGELRYALAIIRIVPELERSGDLAEHIAKRAGSGLAAQLTPAARGMLERMGTLTAQLWRAAADAFVDRDPAAGAALEAADDEVDDLHTAADRELLTGGVPSALAADATLVGAVLRAPRRSRCPHRRAGGQRRRLTARFGRPTGRMSPWPLPSRARTPP